MVRGRFGGTRLARVSAGMMAATLVAGCAAGQARPPSSAAPSSAPPVTAGPRQRADPPGVLPRPGEVRPIPSDGSGLPVISSIPTRRKVVFLTIDDGWEQDPGFLRQVREQRIPITAFVMRDAVEALGAPDPAGGVGKYVGRGKWGYFRQLRDAGVPIENHTLTHPNLRTLGYEAQKAEICGSSKLIRKQIGTRPTLFRPPFGNYGADTQRAAKACGIEALLLWTATVQPGGKIAYQVPDKRLRPGDILLLHFRPDLARDFTILVDKIRRRGYELGNLDAYLKAAVRRAK
ncbi:polysaccharide deacetylase family protein [Nonomuraea sp. NPDC049152]|uniref:polysaccharide deacetylase family protein n=1 Tax=Nonomuraea sp. NPDC049152 TaxID=3154350 RepID=UPI0034002B4B